jgi:translation initiation factor 2 subunit gamma
LELSEPCVNIGLVGHVDHGKTTIVSAFSGEWADRHSEETKRGISIKLGYADATFRKCPKCPEPDAYTVEEKCPNCGTKTEELRTVSFVDAPGHETLMATMLSGAAIMDGAILVISADESCPQSQTKEHLMALNIIDIDKIVVAQNKIDIVSKEAVQENYIQIKEFLRGTLAEDAPIVPISAQHRINMDVLIEEIEENIPTPNHKIDAPTRLLIARSFDVNKPGSPINKLVGGVVGGSISAGILKPKDEIEITPGRFVESGRKGRWEPIFTEVKTIMSGKRKIKEATPGGLIGISTTLDPYITKADALVGQVMGKPGTLPPVWNDFTMDVKLLDRVVGTKEEQKVQGIKVRELLMLNVGTATTAGVVEKSRKDQLEVKLKRPVCADEGSRIAISRRISSRWRLVGVGMLNG